jgi:hypothetical protein
VKYLLQHEWESLVQRAERYEALTQMLGLADMLPREPLRRDQLDALSDQWLQMQAERSRRTSGDSECKACGRPHRQHPRGGPIGWGGEQFLNRLCDGSLVKL